MQTSHPPIRRVVTGHDSSQVAKVLRDEPATNTKSSQPGQVSTLIWCTDGAPAAIPIGEQPEDMGARKIGTAPPAHGTRFAVIDFPPGNQVHMHRTNHAWANRSDKRARVAFVLVDAEPLGIGSPVTGGQSAR